MSISKEKIILKWNKKQKDWLCYYPPSEGRNARITSKAILGFIPDFEQRMSKRWDGTKTDFVSFYKYLIDGGFDPNTFRIECKKLQTK